MKQNFSVSMCVYGKDNPEWFKTAVDSILQQTAEPDEIVLVVDGPVPDELNSVIIDYEGRNEFKVIRFAENKGHGEARRAGVAACTNELVAIMDADDISASNRFEQLLGEFNKDKTVDVVGSQISEFVGEPENIVGSRIVPTRDIDIKEYLKRRCPMNLVSVMFKKSSVEQVGGFIDWYCEEDYFLWARMALAGMHFSNVDAVLVNVRVGKDMYQRPGGSKYFQSEKKLQKYLYQNKIIGVGTYCVNVTERFILQVLMPNRLRGWVFRQFARENQS